MSLLTHCLICSVDIAVETAGGVWVCKKCSPNKLQTHCVGYDIDLEKQELKNKIDLQNIIIENPELKSKTIIERFVCKKCNILNSRIHAIYGFRNKSYVYYYDHICNKKYIEDLNYYKIIQSSESCLPCGGFNW
jgi:hypothetical protein